MYMSNWDCKTTGNWAFGSHVFKQPNSFHYIEDIEKSWVSRITWIAAFFFPPKDQYFISFTPFTSSLDFNQKCESLCSCRPSVILYRTNILMSELQKICTSPCFIRICCNMCHCDLKCSQLSNIKSSNSLWELQCKLWCDIQSLP